VVEGLVPGVVEGVVPGVVEGLVPGEPVAGVVPGVVEGLVPGVVEGVVPGVVEGVVPGEAVEGLVPGVVEGLVPGVVEGLVPGVVPGLVPGAEPVSGTVVAWLCSFGLPLSSRNFCIGTGSAKTRVLSSRMSNWNLSWGMPALKNRLLRLSRSPLMV